MNDSCKQLRESVLSPLSQLSSILSLTSNSLPNLSNNSKILSAKEMYLFDRKRKKHIITRQIQLAQNRWCGEFNDPIKFDIDIDLFKHLTIDDLNDRLNDNIKHHHIDVVQDLISEISTQNDSDKMLYFLDKNKYPEKCLLNEISEELENLEFTGLAVFGSIIKNGKNKIVLGFYFKSLK